MTRYHHFLLVGLTVFLLAGCARPGDEREAVLVSAASSLSDAFAELESVFEQANPRFDVVLNLGGSSLLREQIIGGAPVDVFASANTENMDRVVEARLAPEAEIFARNSLEIAVPLDNPAAVTGLADFGRAELFIGLCDPAVPCGDLARDALGRAGVLPDPDTNEPNARSLLTKVEAGELDAGIVYVTDVSSAEGRVEGVVIPEVSNVIADYPIAVMLEALNEPGAAAFVDFVLSDQGRAILSGHGFIAP